MADRYEKSNDYLFKIIKFITNIFRIGKMNKTIGSEKIKFLDELLNVYRAEINAIYAIAITWNQLKDTAKDVCANDFDQALIARETFLEELYTLRDNTNKNKISYYEDLLKETDQLLLAQGSVVRELYGLDVKSFLSIKNDKLLK